MNIKDLLSLKRNGNNYIITNDGKDAIVLVNSLIEPGESFPATPAAVEAIMKAGGTPYRMRNAMLVQEGRYEASPKKRFELPPEKLVIQIF
ncbi:MAG: hypothetical protein MR409_10685 [Lachnospiraceae bacterium]|nr:hypothetical protein [Lachnospiraceae bacterium]